VANQGAAALPETENLMQFRGQILRDGKLVIRNVVGTITLSESGDEWSGSFAVPAGHVLHMGSCTLLDENGATIEIQIMSLGRGKGRIAEAHFKSQSDWR
jgi:hypothetical protein